MQHAGRIPRRQPPNTQFVRFSSRFLHSGYSMQKWSLKGRDVLLAREVLAATSKPREKIQRTPAVW
jgi:hypothetical protein